MDAERFDRSATTLWLAGTLWPLVLALPTLLLAEGRPSLPLALPLVLLGATTAATVVGVVAIERSLVLAPPRDDATALRRTNRALVLQLVCSHVPTLLGAGLAFALGPPWLVLVGVAGSAAAAAWCRPGPRRRARLDAAWEELGHDVSLARALTAGD